MKVPRPLRLATDVSRLRVLCPHSGNAGRRSAASTAAPAVPPPAERALLSGPRARGDRTDAVEGRWREWEEMRAGEALLAPILALLCRRETPRLPPAHRRSGDSRLLEWGERGSWEALAEEEWRARPHSAWGGGGRRRRERAHPPYVSEDGVRSTPRVEGGVRRVHLITRSSADKGHLEAEASTARAAQPPAGRQTPAPPALRPRLRPLGPVQRSSAHRLAVSPNRPSLSQTPQDCTRARIWGVALD